MIIQDGTGGGYSVSIMDWPSQYSQEPLTLDYPRIKHKGTFYPSPMGIYEDDHIPELPRCEYCGRRQAKKDEPLCPGCGNVV